MASISLYQKLLKQLGGEGLLQAAKAEGVVAKSAAEIPETVLEKIQAKSAPRKERPDAVEKLPTRAELDAIERSNRGSDVSREFRETPEAPPAPRPKTSADSEQFQDSLDLGAIPDSVGKTPGMGRMLKGMGAAGALGAVGYGLTRDWGDPEAPEQTEDVTARSQIEKNSGSGSGSSEAPASKQEIKIPGISIPKVGARPGDYSAGTFSYDDSEYQKTLDALEQKEAAAKGEYQRKQGNSEWGEVAERVAQAAARYGAARQGLKSGVDLSDIKMTGTNWEARRGRTDAELEREQRGLASERALATDSNRSKQAGAERQFEREESAKDKSASQRFREYEDQVRAAQSAKEKADMLAIQDAKQRASEQKAAEAAEAARKADLEDFETKEQIKDKYRTGRESAESKKSAAKEEALAGLHAAYLNGDDKEIEKQRLKATKYLTPQQANALEEAAGSYFGKHKKAARVLEEVLLGKQEEPKDSTPKESGVIIRKDPKTGRNVKYDAKTKKPLGWAD